MSPANHRSLTPTRPAGAAPNPAVQSPTHPPMETVTINGVEYAPVNSRPAGNRAVVVVDRGWIFAGDVTRENGRIYLSRAVWVFRWESCGFSKVIEDPSNADIRPMANVDIPEGAEIFCVPVAPDWGLQ